VAGNVIAIAWTVAVIANVLVWAHHVYMDYPAGSVQAQINVVMQPMTFSLVLPSALSLYSLGFTIYRSRFRWTPASTALFLGLVGWLLAGLSGVVNATIVFDAVVHNTLWVVGHFHHMALLNIGLAVFGAVYALLPELTGKALFSERLAWWHVWLTFGAGSIVFGIWLVQGLDGAPRRWSVLPEEYDTLTRVSLPFVVVLALAQVLFFWNVTQTLRGKAGAASFDEHGIPLPAPKHVRTGGVPALEASIVLLAIALAAGAGVVGYLIGRETADGGGGGRPPATTTTGGEAQSVDGAAVFASAGCGSCHTFTPAGSIGAVGPSLDETTLSEGEISSLVAAGKGGMPSFADRLSQNEIDAVAAYVSEGG
jgi:mono/diheme cytochrome c family protein